MFFFEIFMMFFECLKNKIMKWENMFFRRGFLVEREGFELILVSFKGTIV